MTTDQHCWDYINANMWNVIPMTEETFRLCDWSEIRQVGPDISGNTYLAGIQPDIGVRGYWDPQRTMGALSFRAPK